MALLGVHLSPVGSPCPAGSLPRAVPALTGKGWGPASSPWEAPQFPGALLGHCPGWEAGVELAHLASAPVPLAQLRGEQDHHAQVLHLPHLHGAAPALAGTEQVGSGGWDGSWGVGGCCRVATGSSPGSPPPLQSKGPLVWGHPQRLMGETPSPWVFRAIPAPTTLSSPLQPGPLLPLAL